jgi:hypothetical protein
MERWEGGENCITGSFVVCTFCNYQVEEDEVGGSCITNGEEERV